MPRLACDQRVESGITIVAISASGASAGDGQQHEQHDSGMFRRRHARLPQAVRALFALAVRADSGECLGMTPAMRLILSLIHI